jgi:hypothetical protein
MYDPASLVDLVRHRLFAARNIFLKCFVRCGVDGRHFVGFEERLIPSIRTSELVACAISAPLFERIVIREFEVMERGRVIRHCVRGS